MKVTVLESTPFSMKVRFSDATFNFANALRRTIMTSIPCFAIDRVTFYDNTSAMFDEYIAHRLGLVPLKAPKNARENEEEVFTLNVEGPKTIYSKDLKPSGEVSVANENIPLIKLAQGQTLRVDAKAVVGVGTRSSKFQVALATYTANEKGDSFDFYIESFGQVTAPEALTRALDIISSNVKEIHKELKK